MICRGSVAALCAAALWGVAWAAHAAPATPACQYVKVAELPVTMNGLRPMVTARINGKDALFLLDSGAFYSSLTSDAVSKNDLKTFPAPSTFYMIGASGTHQKANVVKIAEFVYAGIPIKHIDFLVAGATPAPGAVGIIGQNLLGALDVEYDLANGVIRLFQSKDCGEANLAYWSAGKPISILTTGQQTAKQPHIIVDARVNGHPIRAMFDTGASTSVINKAAAGRAGVDVSAKGLTPAGVAYDFAGKQIENSVGSLQSIGIGGEEIRNTRVRIANVTLSESEMLVGDDFFLSHRVLVARSQRRLYFTYNGGPVFRLDQQPKVVTDGADAATPAAQVAASGDGPKTADEFARRGAASAARLDFKAAIADLNTAVAMEPKEGSHYFERAKIHSTSGARMLALADLDKALMLKPAYQDALLMRARLRLAEKDGKGAQADFAEAIKLAPDDKQLPLNIAAAYDDAHLFEPALKIFDAWIAAHPNDDNLAGALNGRCWSRALAGTDLQLALTDCDAAVKRARRAAELDSRGLVLLRMGRFDEAISTYNVAIYQNPKGAWSLYGRGLAKLKTGQTADGQADIHAAIAAQQTIAEDAKSFGVAP